MGKGAAVNEETPYEAVEKRLGVPPVRERGRRNENEFQRPLRALARRGIALAVASKNDEDRAMEMSEHSEMIPRPGDIVAHRIGWNLKAQGTGDLLDELGLAKASCMFIDFIDEPRRAGKGAAPLARGGGARHAGRSALVPLDIFSQGDRDPREPGGDAESARLSGPSLFVRGEANVLVNVTGGTDVSRSTNGQGAAPMNGASRSTCSRNGST